MNNCKCCNKGCNASTIAKFLLVVGGINWGLIGVGSLVSASNNWNVVHYIFGFNATLESVVYVIVGVCAIMSLIGCKCAKCKEACASCAVDSK